MLSSALLHLAVALKRTWDTSLNSSRAQEAQPVNFWRGTLATIIINFFLFSLRGTKSKFSNPLFEKLLYVGAVCVSTHRCNNVSEQGVSEDRR